MKLLLLSLLCYMLVIAVGAHAQPVDDQCKLQAEANADSYTARHAVRIAQNCYGDARDNAPVTIAIRSRVDAANALDEAGKPRSVAVLTERRNNLLDMLISIEGSLTGAMADMDGVWRSHASVTINELRSVKAEISDYESIVPATYWQWHSGLAFFEGPVTGEFLISYGDDIRSVCPDEDFSDECQMALRSAGQLVRHVRLVEQVLDVETRRRLSEIHGQLVELETQWDYYYYEARSQFWWEFIANNAIFDPPDRQFSAPPDGQLILLHPRAAVEYVDEDDSVDESYNLVGIVELVGYNRLRWKKGGPYSKWPLGISAIASFVPGTSGDNWGYGLMIHVKNNYSLGATRRDTGAGNETTWLFSVDLNKLFLEKSEEAKKLFRSP